MSRLKPYRKAVVAVTWGHIISIALLALTAAGVYAAPNTRPIPAAVAAVLANVPKP